MVLALVLASVIALAAWLLLRGAVYLLKFSEEFVKGNRPSFLSRIQNCPRCEAKLKPFTRKVSFKQLLFGGWTCPECGSEFDQMNNVRVARAFDAHLMDFRARKRHGKSLPGASDDKSPIERVFEE
jgi:hypothetical protein